MLSKGASEGTNTSCCQGSERNLHFAFRVHVDSSPRPPLKFTLCLFCAILSAGLLFLPSMTCWNVSLTKAQSRSHLLLTPHRSCLRRCKSFLPQQPWHVDCLSSPSHFKLHLNHSYFLNLEAFLQEELHHLVSSVPTQCRPQGGSQLSGSWVLETSGKNISLPTFPISVNRVCSYRSRSFVFIVDLMYPKESRKISFQNFNIYIYIYKLYKDWILNIFKTFYVNWQLFLIFGFKAFIFKYLKCISDYHFNMTVFVNSGKHPRCINLLYL